MDTNYKPTPKANYKAEKTQLPITAIHSIKPYLMKRIIDESSTKIRFVNDFGKAVTISAPMHNIYTSVSTIYVVQKSQILAIPKPSVVWIKSVCYMFSK